jgi:undecaprenol kinase
MSPRRFFQSARNASRGVVLVFRTEQNFRVQLIFSIVALLLSWYYPLRTHELIVVFLLIGAVLVLEIVNSVFERLADAFRPRLHPIVKEVKDMMAGTVLIMSLVALLVGLLIFGPYVVWTMSRFWIY